METNQAQKPEYIEHQENNNCQQFFGPVSGCVFAMAGSTVNMPPAQPVQEPMEPISEEEIDASFDKPKEELFKHIHYNVTDTAERIRVHKAICNIVRFPKMQQVIDALKEMMGHERILRTVKQESMLSELRRLGLPDGNTPGFSDHNFFSAYKSIAG